MILSCPLCATRYLVPASLFESGPRQVRCARCKHGWQASLTEEDTKDGSVVQAAPPIGAPPAPPVVSPSLAPIDLFPSPLQDLLQKLKKKLPPIPPQIRRALMIVAAGAGLLLFLTVLILARQDIAKALPFMETAYNTFGLTIRHYGEGLSFVKVRSELRYDSGIMKLVVTGEIRNDTRYMQEIPDILASAVGPDGQTIQSWQIDAPAATVAPGSAVAFQSTINAPRSTTVADINLSLIEKPHD